MCIFDIELLRRDFPPIRIVLFPKLPASKGQRRCVIRFGNEQISTFGAGQPFPLDLNFGSVSLKPVLARPT